MANHWKTSPKKLADTPAGLQHMLLRLQGYDLVYHPGKEMVFADALSCLKPLVAPEIKLNITIYHTRITPQKKDVYQQLFALNAEMRVIMDIIITGLPDYQRDTLPPAPLLAIP